MSSVVLFLAGSARADELPASLSLAQAEEIFLAQGFDLLVAEANAEGAEGDLTAAGAHPNPNLALTGFLGPATSHDVLGGNLGTNATSSTLGFSVGISDNAFIEDQLTGKRSLRIEAMAKALAAARMQLEDVKRLELTQLRAAYVAAVLARLNKDAAKESLDTYDQQLKLNQLRRDEGAIGGLDLARVQVAQLEALQSLDAAEAGYQQAIASLAFLLGARRGPPRISLTTDVDYKELPALEGASLESLLQQALEHRTDVKVAEANLAQSEVAVRQARRARIPDIDVQLGYSEQCNSDTCSSAPTFNAGLQGNLPVFYWQQGEIRRAESNALAANHSLEKAKAQVLSDVSQAHAGFIAAQRQVTRMQGQLLSQATLSRDLAQKLYQAGAASLIDFMDAQRAYVASRLEYNQDLANYWTAVYQLEQATSLRLRP